MFKVVSSLLLHKFSELAGSKRVILEQAEQMKIVGSSAFVLPALELVLAMLAQHEQLILITSYYIYIYYMKIISSYS